MLIPGVLTNGNESEEALILEARCFLAARYHWVGRWLESLKCFNGHSTKSMCQILQEWDSYNNQINNQHRFDYWLAWKNSPQ